MSPSYKQYQIFHNEKRISFFSMILYSENYEAVLQVQLNIVLLHTVWSLPTWHKVSSLQTISNFSWRKVNQFFFSKHSIILYSDNYEAVLQVQLNIVLMQANIIYLTCQPHTISFITKIASTFLKDTWLCTKKKPRICSAGAAALSHASNPMLRSPILTVRVFHIWKKKKHTLIILRNILNGKTDMSILLQEDSCSTCRLVKCQVYGSIAN